MSPPHKHTKTNDEKEVSVKKAEVTKHSSPARSAFVSPDHGPTYVISAAPSQSVLSSIKKTRPESLTSTTKNDFLASFGIKPAASLNTSNTQATKNKNSMLKCCLLSAGLDSAILFRLQPIDPSCNNWSEKCLFDALRRHDDWITTLAFDESCLFWFENNLPQRNCKQYVTRMFVIRTEQNPSDDQLLSLGHHVCTKINQLPNNTTTTITDENSYFWIPRETAVWADVIGIDEALAQLTRKLGHPHPGYFELHKTTIDTYFHTGSYSVPLARALHAPVEEIHPSVRMALETSMNIDQEEDDDAI